MSNEERRSNFGERRASRNAVKRGSRPLPNQAVSRELNNPSSEDSASKTTRQSIRPQTSRDNIEDASFSQNTSEVKKTRQAGRTAASGKSTSKNQSGRYTVGTKKNKPRDNSSRFDD